MKLAYQFKLDVEPQEAWRVLTDIPAITPCLPGASIDPDIEDGSEQDKESYKGRMKVKLGPVGMVFKGTMRYVERDDTNHTAKLEAAATEMKGAGSAKSTIDFAVVPADSGSQVSVVTDFQVSGKAAQFGGGVMQSVGKRLMDEFSSRLAEKIEQNKTQLNSEEGDATTRADSSDRTKDDTHLDLLSVAWKPIAIRSTVGALIVALLAVVYLLIR
tara:strand:- start:2649 stop:3293 length:645 start_codon:yes stop_codon:yes gene_type:complete